MSAVVSRTGTVRAAAPEVWEVLADFGALARWVPDVDHSCLLHGGAPGPGTVRRVQIGRSTLLEAVTAWSPREHLAYDITGLPPALRHVTTDWRLRSVDGSTEVTVTTTVDAGPRPPQQLVARLVARRFARAADSMLAGLGAALTSGDRTSA